jgi:F-type H+-transporting ATPase subunit a
VLVEKGVGMMMDLTGSAMGTHNLHWTPFMGCLFLCSLIGSYIGMTGFLRSSTADINCTDTWALMVSFIIWFNNIKKDGIVNFLKNYLNPMNIISDLSQPLSMSFRHFSNVSVGTIISTILYAALSALSATVIGLVSQNGWIMGIVVLTAGVLLAALWARKTGKVLHWIIAGVTIAIGLLGLLEALGILTGVPLFTYGIPGVLGLYFDFFSGFIQALVFTMLSMVYIAGSLPGPEEEKAE